MTLSAAGPRVRVGDAGVPHDLRSLLAKGEIHFMGVGGAGMCALAEAVARSGGKVTGCDRSPGAAVRALEALGVGVESGHDPRHVEGVGALVVSAAVPADHPEVQAARKLGIPVYKRAVALGAWVNAGKVVAVSGTHGKTTTTAMITEILATAGMDPTGFVGGEVPTWKSHLRPGSSDLFVVEADEYDRSFHHLRPTIALVTNLEADHLDIYGDLAGVREAFRIFLEGVVDGGFVVLCADDPGAGSLTPWAGPDAWSYGLSAGSRVRAVSLRTNRGGSRFRVLEDGRGKGEVALRVPGDHNVRNALGAATAARALGVQWDAIRAGLGRFAGVRRRFQRLGEVGGIMVVDDYAHHPTEVQAAVAAARSAEPGRRVVAVFQPHLFTRTRDFTEGFGRALAAADEVWVTAIYPAREEPIPGVDEGLVARHVEAAGREEGSRVQKTIIHAELGSLPAALAKTLRPGDLCLTMGAGSIETVGPMLVGALEANHA